MDWMKKTEEIFQEWTNGQKKMWDSWNETIKTASSQNQAVKLWEKTIETWEDSVKNAMSVQDEISSAWTKNIDKTNVPKEFVQWIEQAQDMNKKWNDVQGKLWKDWFDLMKKVDISKMTDIEKSQETFKEWQELSQKVLEKQTEFFKSWSAGKKDSKAS